MSHQIISKNTGDDCEPAAPLPDKGAAETHALWSGCAHKHLPGILFIGVQMGNKPVSVTIK